MLNDKPKRESAMVTKNDGLRQYRCFAGVLGLITVSVLLLVATHTAPLSWDAAPQTGAPVTQQ
jgi:hypothetical protein